MTAVHHNGAVLVLAGAILAVLAVGVGATWVDDGDGTCGAIYQPNLARVGCARKLLPPAVTSAVLAGGAVLAGDAARRSTHRPARFAWVAVGAGTVAVIALFGVLIGLDRQGETGGGGPSPPPTGPPATTVPRP